MLTMKLWDSSFLCRLHPSFLLLYCEFTGPDLLKPAEGFVTTEGLLWPTTTVRFLSDSSELKLPGDVLLLSLLLLPVNSLRWLPYLLHSSSLMTVVSLASMTVYCSWAQILHIAAQIGLNMLMTDYLFSRFTLQTLERSIFLTKKGIFKVSSLRIRETTNVSFYLQMS